MNNALLQDNGHIELGDLKDLPNAARAQVRAAARALERADAKEAERLLTLAFVFAPEHPELHRLGALAMQRMGRYDEAVRRFQRALALGSRSRDLLVSLAQAQARVNDLPGAVESARALVASHADADSLFLLGTLLDANGELDEAASCMQQALDADPGHSAARLSYARGLFYRGRIEDAEAQFRDLILRGRQAPNAWYGLAEMKTVRFSEDDRNALEALSARLPRTSVDRMIALHALGKAHEDARDYAAAFATFAESAAIEKAADPWNGEAFLKSQRAMRAAFPNAVSTVDEGFGSEVIFIIGLPRSGSTLVEQVLAAHPAVEGANELPDLHLLIAEESARRRAPLTEWASQATAGDWRRLGEAYLARTARWRQKRARFTDKRPDNWILAEAALAMLPGAHFIDCRRDAVETCWSCFKQFFAPGIVPWTTSFDDLARYWLECRRHCNHLAARYPRNVRLQSYERLVDDPQGQMRDLLAFCGLAPEPAGLDFLAVQRPVRTPSAAQVRQPMQRGKNADLYDPDIAPLRQLLARAEEEVPFP